MRISKLIYHDFECCTYFSVRIAIMVRVLACDRDQWKACPFLVHALANCSLLHSFLHEVQKALNEMVVY